MSSVEAASPDFISSNKNERPKLRLVEATPIGHELMRANADAILLRYAMDFRFDTLSQLMAQQGINVQEFISDDHRYGLSIHFNPSRAGDAPDKVEAGLYMDENDRLESIEAGYFGDSGEWSGFASQAGDGQEPPARVAVALSAVASWLDV